MVKVLALAVTLAGAAALPVVLASAGAAQPASTAPECVSVAVHAYQLSGGFTTTWLEFCGSGPGGDSALHDWAQGHRFTLDGAIGLGNGCGGEDMPCVIFPGP